MLVGRYRGYSELALGPSDSKYSLLELLFELVHKKTDFQNGKNCFLKTGKYLWAYFHCIFTSSVSAFSQKWFE